MKLTLLECRMLCLLGHKWDNDMEVERKSQEQFDLIIKGKRDIVDRLSAFMGVTGGLPQFSAWMVLSAIDDLTEWSKPLIADMTDYPEMARDGDWSAVRDTNEDKLWQIFNEYCLPQIEQPV